MGATDFVYTYLLLYGEAQDILYFFRECGPVMKSEIVSYLPSNLPKTHKIVVKRDLRLNPLPESERFELKGPESFEALKALIDRKYVTWEMVFVVTGKYTPFYGRPS